MTIDLKPEHERTIELAIECGACRNHHEVLDQAFDILREQLNNEDWMRGQRDAIASQIATGFAEAENGQLMDGKHVVRTSQPAAPSGRRRNEASVSVHLAEYARSGRYLALYSCRQHASRRPCRGRDRHTCYQLARCP